MVALCALPLSRLSTGDSEETDRPLLFVAFERPAPANGEYSCTRAVAMRALCA